MYCDFVICCPPLEKESLLGPCCPDQIQNPIRRFSLCVQHFWRLSSKSDRTFGNYGVTNWQENRWRDKTELKIVYLCNINLGKLDLPSFLQLNVLRDTSRDSRSNSIRIDASIIIENKNKAVKNFKMLKQMD
jgi:hypothetical protein